MEQSRGATNWMEQSRAATNWVQAPEFSQWGFQIARPELLKIPIDRRPKHHHPTYYPPPERGNRPELHTMLEKDRQARNSQAEGQQSGGESGGTLFRKENQRPGSFQDKNITPFVVDNNEGARGQYFGGPILDKSILQWRQNYFTRACGDVIGASDFGISLPLQISTIIKSVAVMRSTHMTQSAIWIGPRLLLSTLHLHPWIRGFPSNEECYLFREVGQAFDVESEICSQVLSTHSSKVQLLAFSAENDIGIFKLQDRFPPRSDWVDPSWLVERDEVYKLQLDTGRKVACVGFNGKINEEDLKKIKEETKIQPQAKFSAEARDLDTALKPEMKSFAPGTLDNANANGERTLFGVSCSVWKGSSGGPCVLLDGVEGGAIIGLVRGYDFLSDPFNLVNGFPAGLRAEIGRL